MMRLRKIWAEGSFSVLKRKLCLSKIRKRGIPAVKEECLLSIMALNLKRMVKAILFTSYMLKTWAENINFQPSFLFVNRSFILPYPYKREQFRVRPAFLFIHILCKKRNPSVIFYLKDDTRISIFPVMYLK